MPCNYNQRRLAESVKEGIRAAGGTPMEFNTVSVTDGVTMGTEGMKASLISREVIADSIELVVRGHLFDGVVCLVGCDKTMPGAAMALGRLDVPGLASTTGRSIPACTRAERRRRERLRGDRGVPGRQDRPRGAARGGERRLSRSGRLRRPVHRQHDERWSWSSSGSRPAASTASRPRIRGRTRRRADAASWSWTSSGATSGRRHRDPGVARERDRIGRRDRRLHERRPPPPGHRPRVRHRPRHRRLRDGRRPDAAHRRHEARRPLRRRRPVRRRRRRAGHARAPEAGPPRRRPRRPSTAGRSPRSRPTRLETPGQQVVVPIETPIKPTGGLAILRGSLAPDGCVVKLAGHERRLHRGPARVFDSEADCYAAVRAGRSSPATSS